MERHRIDKAALRETITSLEGLTNEQKADLLQLLSEQKRYGLVWEDHAEDVEEQLRTKLPVLSEVKDKLIIPPPSEGSGEVVNHILIEGDNLHALTALTYTHEGRVDVIYIDPPYNTGNKDFVYNDSFVDKEDSFRHSKWLSFMHKRLTIAKRLLSDRGVIFISIDNNEYAQLKTLCDELFHERNFVEMLKWKRKKQPSFLARHTAAVMEYILVYAKSYYDLDKLSIEGSTDSTKKVLNISNNESQRHFPQGVRIKIPGNGCLKAGEYTNKTLSIKLLQDLYYSEGRTLNEIDIVGKFADSQERITKFIDQDLLFITANKGLRRDVSEEEKGKRKSITDLLLDWGDNQDSENELKDIFGYTPFDYAKPSKLIYNLIKSFNSENSLILDFFAGSGTTLHATMQLNSEDGGHRQCILVTNNENGICENVTYERNRRVIEGYTTPKGVEVPGLSGNNLRYYRTDFVERETTLTAKRQLMMASTELLCIKHDIYDEQLTFGNIKLRPTIARYFAPSLQGKAFQGPSATSSGQVHSQQMLIIYRPEAIESLVAEIAQMPECTNILVYVFSTNNYAMDADFEAVSDKVTLCALPAAIYNAYLRVLPKREMHNNDNPSTSSGQAKNNQGGTEA